ncbi:MAG: cyclic di-GMP phosphodiesterase [Solirubrobacterales bacterium]|jgi:putative two-component system response regulator|nr:cyclic di-GMP phosphodiesterase [Solirubrobacterales bacterium]
MTPKARILAIDNDSEILEMVQQVLGGRYECELASDVATARQRLVADGFNVVLCDVQMPGESGLALVEELAAESEATAVVPIAGTEDPTLVEHALEIGVFGYLVKPFSPGQLLITTETALRRLEAEAAERARRRRLQETIQAAVDRAPIPIFVKDLERRYLLANQFAHELMRQEPGEMIGRTDAEMHSPETERVIHEGDMQVLHDEEPSFREVTIEIMGRERTFLTVRFPYIGVDGNLAGIVGVSAEITAQREAEQLQRDLAGARARAIEELRSSRQEALERMAQAIEMHDSEVGRHVNRMARVTSYLASQLGLGDEQIQLIRAAAPMHDVGKVATPEKILRKPGSLTPEERLEMQRHTEIGYRILSGSESELLQMAARIALTHHEWFDGTGYPQGLEGEEIPIEGRIVAVADVFDALLSDRPYRPALGIDEAIETIRNGRGTQFDPEVADVLLEHSDAVVELRG